MQVAATADQRALWWKGRKSAFGAIARVAPDYYLHDAVVPRTKLAPCWRRSRAIAAATTSSCSTCSTPATATCTRYLVFDAREPGVLDRVHAAGAEIVAVSLAAGGVLSGEHGIGLEKRDHMLCTSTTLRRSAQARLREAFDPDGVANPTKILPSGSRCGDLQRIPDGQGVSAPLVAAFAEAVGPEAAGPVVAIGGWAPGGVSAGRSSPARARSRPWPVSSQPSRQR